jgi:hypothetical protein
MLIARSLIAAIVVFFSTYAICEEQKYKYNFNFLLDDEAVITDEDAKFIANTVLSEGTILTVRDVSKGSENFSVFDFIVSYKKKIWGCRSVVSTDGYRVKNASTRCKQN